MMARYIVLVALLCVTQILIGSGCDYDDEPPIPYEWVNNTAEVFNSTRLVYTAKSNVFSYVIARSVHDNGDKLPCEGVVSLNRKELATLLLPISENYTNIEVLLVDPGYYDWVSTSWGVVDGNAVEGGKIGNETVYVCRVRYGDTFFTGVLQPSSGGCNVRNLFEKFSDYDHLIYTCDETDNVLLY